jgi:hypothetical protein
MIFGLLRFDDIDIIPCCHRWVTIYATAITTPLFPWVAFCIKRKNPNRGIKNE